MVRCVRMQGRAVHERGGHRESLLCRIPVSSRGHAVAPFDCEETRQAWPLLTFLTCLRRIFLGALPQNTIAGDTPRAEQQLDRATWPRLADVLAVGFRTRTRDEWTATFLGTDACCVPVLEPLEVDDAGRGPNESGVGAGNADSSLIGYPSPRASTRSHTRYRTRKRQHLPPARLRFCGCALAGRICGGGSAGTGEAGSRRGER